MSRILSWRVLGLKGLKILYGLVVLGSPLHMRDSHGRHDAEENSTLLQISLFFSRCPPIVAAMLCSSQFTMSLAKGMEMTWLCVWRWEEVRELNSNHSLPLTLLPHSATQYNMDNFLIRHLYRFLSSYLLFLLSPGYSPLLCSYSLNDHSWPMLSLC
jgi:hypothetical protein